MPVTAATREALQAHFGAASLQPDPEAYLAKDFAALIETVALAAGMKLESENKPVPKRPRSGRNEVEARSGLANSQREGRSMKRLSLHCSPWCPRHSRWPVGASSPRPRSVFGASLPLTGGLAINGQKHKEGYELCIDLINKNGGLLGEPATIDHQRQPVDQRDRPGADRAPDQPGQGERAARHLLEPHHLRADLGRRAEQDGLSGPVRRGAADLRARLQIHLQLPAERRRISRQVLCGADEGSRASRTRCRRRRPWSMPTTSMPMPRSPG